MTAFSPTEQRDAARSVDASPMHPTVVRVRTYRRETHDVFTLVIELPEGHQFSPGQFHMMYVFGVGEIPISVSGGSAARRELVATVRAVGSVTRAMSRLRAGDSLGLRGPFGSSWPLADAERHDVLIVAGGMGMVPLRPVVNHVVKYRSRFGRVALLYGARSPRDILFSKEVEKWRGRFNLQALVTVDSADAGWHGHVGVVTTLFHLAEFDPHRTVVMTCGPEVMMRFALREIEQRGIADDRVYVSMERNMQCAVGFCGHCQFGPSFVCMDGPVFRFDRIKPCVVVREA
jgi:NAD(P)H-flavin reductase